MSLMTWRCGFFQMQDWMHLLGDTRLILFSPTCIFQLSSHSTLLFPLKHAQLNEFLDISRRPFPLWKKCFPGAGLDLGSFTSVFPLPEEWLLGVSHPVCAEWVNNRKAYQHFQKHFRSFKNKSTCSAFLFLHISTLITFNSFTKYSNIAQDLTALCFHR